MKTVGAVLAFAFLASTASAAVVYVPCEDYGIPAPHTALLPSSHVVHHKTRGRGRHHRYRRAKGHSGSRVALLRGMCPVWLDDSLGGPAGAWPASGGWFEETADLSDSAGVLLTSSPAIGAGGYDDSGQPPAPLFTISVSPPLGFLPLPSRIPTPVPEMGTWLLMLIGFAGIVVVGLRRGEA